MLPPIRRNVLGMHPYSPGKPISEVKRELGLERIIKLASNENPLGPSPKAVAAIRGAASELNLYPDGATYELKEAISRKYGVPHGQIIVGNGSDELIHLLGLIFLGSGEDEVVVANPSFVRYDAVALLAPCRLTRVPARADYRIDLAAMASAITERTKLVFIANPNNPTGAINRRSEMNRFVADLPSGTVLVLDEAYFEFAMDQPDYPNSLEYIKEGKSVVGLRTFSKAFGLAGIRLGFGFAPEEVVDGMDRAREPFNVNSLAQVAGIAALEDDDHVQRTLENNREGMQRMTLAFEQAGAIPVESFANFVFVDLGRPSRPVFEALLKQGVITRPGDIFGTPNCLRVTVGTAEEVTVFVEAFTSVMREPATK